MTWSGDTIDFAGHGLEGNLTVGESDAHVQVRLGSLLGLMKPLVEAEIRRQLQGIWADIRLRAFAQARVVAECMV